MPYIKWTPSLPIFRHNPLYICSFSQPAVNKFFVYNSISYYFSFLRRYETWNLVMTSRESPNKQKIWWCEIEAGKPDVVELPCLIVSTLSSLYSTWATAGVTILLYKVNHLKLYYFQIPVCTAIQIWRVLPKNCSKLQNYNFISENIDRKTLRLDFISSLEIQDAFMSIRDSSLSLFLPKIHLRHPNKLV